MKEGTEERLKRESKTAEFPQAMPAGRQVSRGIHLPGERKAVWVGLVLVGVIGVIGLVFYLRRPKGPKITNFQECVQAGNPVLESYPPQCQTQKGEVFVEEIPMGEGPPPEEVCEDLCGDGICQEVVCMAVGCPCPETPESCPEDCALHNAD